MANILVVEDQDDLREVWAEELDLLGNHVRRAANGQDGWESFQQESFDLIVLDIGLPRRTGLEVLNSIRQQDPGVPVVIVTAVTDPGIARIALNAGATDVLFKPITLANLRDVVSRLIRRPG